MSIRSTLESIGEYALLLRRVLMPPDRAREFAKEFSKETYKLGVNSIWIVTIISLSIGAVIVMQIAYNIKLSAAPTFDSRIGAREIIILEFSSTVICLILAGKVGSNIASEIGTMRITQQIDALDIMGVNSANFLILPKIGAFVLFMPVLVIFSTFMGLYGGYVFCAISGNPSPDTYIYGIQFFFRESLVWYSLIKSMLFGFIYFFGGRSITGTTLEAEHWMWGRQAPIRWWQIAF